MFVLKLIYNEVFYRPLLNGLLFFTSLLPGRDLGLAVILLTALVRAATFPLTHKMLKTQSAMKKLEPELKKIYSAKKNKEEQSRAVMELYKAHGVNPFSGFLAILLQFPLLLALFQVFNYGSSFDSKEIYFFVNASGGINTLFLGLIELSKPAVIMSFLAALSQSIQMKLATPTRSAASVVGGESSTQSDMQKMMTYTFPVIIFFVGFKLPAAVCLYWTAMNVFAIIHEAAVRRRAASVFE